MIPSREEAKSILNKREGIQQYLQSDIFQSQVQYGVKKKEIIPGACNNARDAVVEFTPVLAADLLV